MKKNIYLTILAVITVVCIIIGALRNIGGFWKDDNVRYETETIQPAGTGTGIENAKDAAVTEIRAEVDYGNLTVKTGEEFSAEFNGDSDLKPDVSLKNGILSIVQTGSSWNFFKNLINPKAELTVTLPKGTRLSRADIILDLGDADISGLIVKNGTVVNNLGRIELASCKLGTMDIEADMGDVEITDSEFYNLSIEEDLGNVRVDSAKDLSAAAIDLETDLGKIVVNGNDQGTAFRTAGTGDIRLSVHNDMGDVEVEF